MNTGAVLSSMMFMCCMTAMFSSGTKQKSVFQPPKNAPPCPNIIRP